MGSVMSPIMDVFTMGATAAMRGLTPAAPSIPAPAKPETPPASQAANTPSAGSVQGQMAGAGQAGGSPGVAQTMLTGPGGVDPTSLTLGRNSLLGS